MRKIRLDGDGMPQDNLLYTLSICGLIMGVSLVKTIKLYGAPKFLLRFKYFYDWLGIITFDKS
jgi:hypothetical protein